MHKKASKARGEDNSWIGGIEHAPVGRDDWNKIEAGNQIAFQSIWHTHLGELEHTVHVMSTSHVDCSRSPSRQFNTEYCLFSMLDLELINLPTSKFIEVDFNWKWQRRKKKSQVQWCMKTCLNLNVIGEVWVSANRCVQMKPDDHAALYDRQISKHAWRNPEIE